MATMDCTSLASLGGVTALDEEGIAGFCERRSTFMGLIAQERLTGLGTDTFREISRAFGDLAEFAAICLLYLARVVCFEGSGIAHSCYHACRCTSRDDWAHAVLMESWPLPLPSVAGPGPRCVHSALPLRPDARAAGDWPNHIWDVNVEHAIIGCWEGSRGGNGLRIIR